MRRPLAVFAAFVTLICGCGGSSDEEPRQVGRSAGLKRYEVASQEFSLGVPPRWRVVSGDEVLTEDEREALTRENPEFAPFLEGIGSESQPIKLFAFDPRAQRGFATNLNVVVVAVPSGLTLDEFVQANRAQLAKLGRRIQRLDEARTRLPSGPAGRLAYRLRLSAGGRERPIETLQYFLVEGDRGYIVTFSTLPELRSRYAQVFDRTVRSLRVD